MVLRPEDSRQVLLGGFLSNGRFTADGKSRIPGEAGSVGLDDVSSEGVTELGSKGDAQLRIPGEVQGSPAEISFPEISGVGKAEAVTDDVILAFLAGLDRTQPDRGHVLAFSIGGVRFQGVLENIVSGGKTEADVEGTVDALQERLFYRHDGNDILHVKNDRVLRLKDGQRFSLGCGDQHPIVEDAILVLHLEEVGGTQ